MAASLLKNYRWRHPYSVQYLDADKGKIFISTIL
jgi:hypothetical protein